MSASISRVLPKIEIRLPKIDLGPTDLGKRTVFSFDQKNLFEGILAMEKGSE